MPEETSTTTDKIEPEFQIVNNGSSSVALSQLTIRYWFTADSSATLNPGCNYAVVGCSNVTETTGAVNPPVTGADSYLQVGFTSSAGSVAANSNGGKIKLIVQKSDFSNFDQTNDYSFNGKTFNLSSQSGCLSSGVGGYFKAGDYGQENTLSVVTFYSVVVNHS